MTGNDRESAELNHVQKLEQTEMEQRPGTTGCRSLNVPRLTLEDEMARRRRQGDNITPAQPTIEGADARAL